MIISKPQTGTILSFSLFLVITIVVIVMNVLAISLDANPMWYNYLILALLIPMGSFVIYKIFIRYQVIQMGNNKISVRLPVLRKFREYSLANIIAWAENKVKTGKNSNFKELQILFDDGKKIVASHKEHTEYDRMLKYLSQKAPGKKVEAK